MKIRTLFLILCLALCACTPPPPPTKIVVSVVADGLNSSYELTEPVTVQKFLQDIKLELSELDRVNPPPFTQISDGILIEVVRVQEENYCEDRDIPYQQRTQTDERLPTDSPGVQVQPGINGKESVCYRVEIRNGLRQTPAQVGDPVMIQLPQDEIIYVPPPSSLDPVEIVGTLAYLSKGDAWVMRGSSQLPNRRPVTTGGDVDDRVFSLSADGNQLLFTRKTGDVFGNELWLLPNVYADTPQSVQLRPTNVLYAAWYPATPNTITYSTAEPRSTNPGWDARNDLRRSLIDPQTGEEISIDLIIDEYSGGLAGWWGTKYYWSPDGSRLAYVHADSVGIVNLETGERQPLVSYEVLNVFSNWSWRTSISWSPDNNLIATTVHGASPSASLPADKSPVFNLAILNTDGRFTTEIINQAGIWSNPSFSPFIVSDDSTFPEGYLAYMVARQPLDSVNDSAQYDLYVADRDGSNARKVFPSDTQAGILSREYVWSPDGRQLAIIYQDNVWLIDAASGTTRQVTLDGSVTRLVWAW
ncbi:MAG: DPP IV N-terminal domain-containing protein [Anaerolineae bacterium]|nr:DPP IV N-terminal domain-containing protein [Anaerolineae bacterium]